MSKLQNGIAAAGAALSSDKTLKIQLLGAAPMVLLMGAYLAQLIYNVFTPYSYNALINLENYPVYRAAHILSFIFAAAAFILCALQKKRSGQSPVKDLAAFVKANPTVWLFALLLLIEIITTAINGTQYIITPQYFMNLPLIGFAEMVLIYFLPMLLVKSTALKKALLGILFGLSIFQAMCVFIILPFVDYDMALCGLFMNRNHYAYFLTPVIMTSGLLSLTEKKGGYKDLCMSAFFVNSAVLAVNDTLGSIIACLFGFVLITVMLSLTRGKFYAKSLILPAVFIAVCFVANIWVPGIFSSLISTFADIGNIVEGEITGSEGSGRMTLWLAGLEMIGRRPIIGYGISNYGDELSYTAHSRFTAPHNEFMEMALTFGLPALAAYAAGCFMAFLRALKNKSRLSAVQLCLLAAAFAYLVSSFFGTLMYYTLPLPYLLIGLAINYDDRPAEGA